VNDLAKLGKLPKKGFFWDKARNNHAVIMGFQLLPATPSSCRDGSGCCLDGLWQRQSESYGSPA
jgi:hypothetical protein